MKAKYLVLAIALVLAVSLIALTAAQAPSAEAKSPRAVKECNDGFDNDGDGDIDLADAGCRNPGDNDETNCGDGVCEGGETCSDCQQDCGPCDSCSDTDGGFNLLVQGTVSGYLDGDPYSHTDECNGTVLLEWYCSGGGTQPAVWPFECAGNFTTCSNGACI